jgi:hypothetical protein
MPQVKTQVRQSKMLLYLIILVGLVGGYMYYSYSGASEVVVPQVQKAGRKGDLAKFENMKIDFDFLNEQSYKSLQIYGELPVNPGTPGRQNIFAPIR